MAPGQLYILAFVRKTACGVIFMTKKEKVQTERPTSRAQGIFDNDLARDNLENHIPFADLQDL